MKTATSNNVPFHAIGGGHGISDYRSFEGVAIDLSNFKSTYLNETANLLTVGAATEYSQLYSILFDAGKELRMYRAFIYCPLQYTMTTG